MGRSAGALTDYELLAALTKTSTGAAVTAEVGERAHHLRAGAVVNGQRQLIAIPGKPGKHAGWWSLSRETTRGRGATGRRENADRNAAQQPTAIYLPHISTLLEVSAPAAKRPVPRRIPALSGRTSAHRPTAPSAFRPRRLLGRIAPAINPEKKPRRKNPRARRLFLRITADAMNPHVAAMMATARSREIRCVGPSDPISQPPGRRLRRPLARSNHRLRRTSIAGQCS